MYNRSHVDLLHSDGAHIWYLLANDFDPGESIVRFCSLLTRDEEERRVNFHFEKDRHQFLLTRYLVKSVLSTYFPTVAPCDWRFSVNRYGRPSVSAPSICAEFSFNLSHTNNVIVCAVSVLGNVGIDVEFVRNDRQVVGISDRFFSPKEVDLMRSLREHEKSILFYRLWTLKEAFVKAEGRGLSIAFDKFWFEISSRSIRIYSDSALDVECSKYSFVQTRFYSNGKDTGCELGVALRTSHRLIEVPKIKVFHFDREGCHKIESLLFSSSSLTT